MLFGKIQTFDEASGGGTIKPENGNGVLHFVKSAVRWGDATTRRPIAAFPMKSARTNRARIAPSDCSPA